MKGVLSLVLCCLTTPTLADMLPPGIGAYQLGYRVLTQPGRSFDSQGALKDIGDRYSFDLSGGRLLSGTAGDDLRLLAGELKKFEPEGDASLLNQLTLGEYEIETDVNVDSMILGFAYGVAKRWNVFVGVPWVRARVDFGLRQVRGNNALEIADRLGTLAFSELTAGLQEASGVNEDLLFVRLESDYGYKALGPWRYEGFGDVLLGSRFGGERKLNRRWKETWQHDVSLTLPTGRVDDPDMLQDADIGSGAVALAYGSRVQWTWRGFASAGLYGSYKYSHEHERDIRVPENKETLIRADRKAAVRVKHGDTFEQGLAFGMRKRFLTAGLDIGKTRAFGDRYSGSLDGAYGELSRDSDGDLFYDRWSLQFDSTRAYQRKKFPVPAIIGVSAQFSRGGRNQNPDDYYQIDLTSFLKN